MGSKVFVGNLSFNVSDDQLRALFEGEGLQVQEVNIVKDRDTGRPRGFAFVEMASDEAARTAIEKLDGQELDGRALRVAEAREKAPRRGGGGYGGGGGGGGYRGGGGGGGGGGRGRGGPRRY